MDETSRPWTPVPDSRLVSPTARARRPIVGANAHTVDVSKEESLFPVEDMWLEPWAVPPQGTLSTPAASEGKRSIRYMTQVVVEFGKVTGLDDLLARVSWLCLVTDYSPYNSLLILLQRPGASCVLPAHHWLDRFGHVVRPGEQPLVLLQPGGPLMFLLDASQVEPGPGALPLPQALGNPYAMGDLTGADEMLHWIVENAKFDGVRVSPAPLGQGFAGCVRHSGTGAAQGVIVRKRPKEQIERIPVRYDVELNRNYSSTEQLATLAHELGHVYCGHLGAGPPERWKGHEYKDDLQREHEAESVARVVFRALAPGVELPDHLGQYFAREPQLADVDLEAVLKAAGRILDIARKWNPRWKSGPKDDSRRRE